jgi:hypothetical protein
VNEDKTRPNAFLNWWSRAAADTCTENVRWLFGHPFLGISSHETRPWRAFANRKAQHRRHDYEIQKTAAGLKITRKQLSSPDNADQELSRNEEITEAGVSSTSAECVARLSVPGD